MDVKKPAQQGSFGIPQNMREAHDRQRQQREQREQAERDRTNASTAEDTLGGTQPEQPAAKTDEAADKGSQAPGVDDKIVDETDPAKILAQLGITLEDADLETILFKGYIEKEIPLVGGKIKATLKTLTGEEYEWVDELLAADVRSKPMTDDGFASRRSMWILAFGVTKLQGKPVIAPVVKDKKVDPVETAKAKRVVLSKLNPQMLINPMIKAHGKLATALNLMGEKPETLLKNS